MRRPVSLRSFPYQPPRAAAGLAVALALGLAWQASAPVVLAHGTLHERQARLMAEIEAQPGDALLRCRLAELFCEHGDYPEARGALAEAERLDPGLALVDLVRGDLAELRASGTIGASSCQGSATTATTRTDATSPAPDSGFYYLVQARNACGAGGWGAARSRTNCP